MYLKCILKTKSKAEERLRLYQLLSYTGVNKSNMQAQCTGSTTAEPVSDKMNDQFGFSATACVGIDFLSTCRSLLGKVLNDLGWPLCCLTVSELLFCF